MKHSNSDGINTSLMMINVVNSASVSNLNAAAHVDEYVNNNGQMCKLRMFQRKCLLLSMSAGLGQ
jgi:hypothetical protein